MYIKSWEFIIGRRATTLISIMPTHYKILKRKLGVIKTMHKNLKMRF